jgi:hypothetical protein
MLRSITGAFSCCCEQHSEHPSKVVEMEFVLFAFCLKADIENFPENLQMVLSIGSAILI